jgi:flagellar secretion chaperone FliS
MNMAMTRNRFLADTVATAGPQQILVMLYDRLVLDLNRAEVAQRNGQLAQASDYLGHAQEIVGSLASTLDVDAWSGGQSLMDLYMYLVREMVGASIDGDADRTAACTAIAVPLRDTWREAAASLAASAASMAATATPLIPTQRPRAAFGEPTLGGELGVG